MAPGVTVSAVLFTTIPPAGRSPESRTPLPLASQTTRPCTFHANAADGAARRKTMIPTCHAQLLRRSTMRSLLTFHTSTQPRFVFDGRFSKNFAASDMVLAVAHAATI